MLPHNLHLWLSKKFRTWKVISLIMSIAIQQRQCLRLSQFNSLQTKCNRFTQHRQCNMKTNLCAFVQPLLQCKSLKYCLFWLCVCSLRYPACNGRALYRHLLPAPHDFRKIKLWNSKRVFSSTNFLATFLILRRIQWDVIIHVLYIGFHIKYPLFLSDFNVGLTWIFSTDIQNKLQHQISWKSVQWEPSSSMRTDGQTWRGY